MRCKDALFKILNESSAFYSDKSSCKDARKSFSINSRRRAFCTIKVDGGIINSTAIKKCDFIIVDCDDYKFYFIELKGSKIERAYEQILSTIDFVKHKYKTAERRFDESQIAINIICHLGTKSNQRKEEIIDKCFRKFSILPAFHTKDSVSIPL